MIDKINGGVTAAKGFQASCCAAGIRYAEALQEHDRRGHGSVQKPLWRQEPRRSDSRSSAGLV